MLKQNIKQIHLFFFQLIDTILQDGILVVFGS